MFSSAFTYFININIELHHIYNVNLSSCISKSPIVFLKWCQSLCRYDIIFTLNVCMYTFMRLAYIYRNRHSFITYHFMFTLTSFTPFSKFQINRLQLVKNFL